MADTSTQKQPVDFYFDPSCPWAWRTALWIQEVEKVRPIEVTWKFLCCWPKLMKKATTLVNHMPTVTPRFRSWLGRANVLAMTRFAVSMSLWARRVTNARNPFGDPEVIERALKEAGLDPAWRTEAASDPGVEERIMAEHQEAMERHGAFGVPTISVAGKKGFFGPVIN